MAGGPERCGNCNVPLLPKLVGGKSYPACPQCGTLWPWPRVLELVHRHRRPAPACKLSLVYEPNETDHNDLVLRIGNWAHRSDSYYFELDHPVGTPPNVRASLRALLAQWRSELERCGEGETMLLAYDFSDQYTGWVRGRRIASSFEVVAGWSRLEGWAVYPSDFLEAVPRVKDFEPVEGFGQPMRISREEAFDGVTLSLDLLEKDAPRGP